MYGPLSTVILFAIMGMVGQGVRAIVGLKSAATEAAQDPTKQVEFNAAYLLLSLMIGAIAGVVAGFVLKLKIDPTGDNSQILLAIAAAGYSGADFIENAFTKFLPDVTKTAAPSTDADKGGTEKPAPVPTQQEKQDSAKACMAIAKSVSDAFAGLGDAPLSLLHEAAGASDAAKPLLAMAVDTYAATSAAAKTTADLGQRAQRLVQNPNVGEDAKALLTQITQASNDFNAALKKFTDAKTSIIRVTAKG